MMKFEYQDRKKKIIRYLICILLGIIGAVGLFFVVECRSFFTKKNSITGFKPSVQSIKPVCKECAKDTNNSVNSINTDKREVLPSVNQNLTAEIKTNSIGNDVEKAEGFQRAGGDVRQSAQNSEYGKLVEKLANSVVHIKLISLREIEDDERYSLLNALGGEVFPNKKIKTMASCSGFFVSDDGYIVTNHHCIDEVQDIEVELKDGRNYKASVVGYFEGADLAVIKIKRKAGEKFEAVKIGNSDELSVGENVLIIGGPLGYKWSASAGIVSGKARNIDYAGNTHAAKKHSWGTAGEIIQIDAAVNPGNSGGPAFNMKGEVVGVASAGFLFLQGMNFIVASNTLKEYLPDLKKGKIVQKGLLGVSLSELEPYDLKAIGIQKNSGLLVQNVIKFGPAEKAGIKRGDVITHVNGIELKDAVVMKTVDSKVFDGSVSDVEVNRYGKLMRFKVKAISVSEMEKLEKGEIGIQEWDDKNISYRLLTSAKHTKFNFPKNVEGIIVTSIRNNDNPMLVLAIGDVIVGVNDKAVKSIEDYQKIIFDLRKRKKSMAVFHIYKPITKNIVVKGSSFD